MPIESFVILRRQILADSAFGDWEDVDEYKRIDLAQKKLVLFQVINEHRLMAGKFPTERLEFKLVVFNKS